MCGNMCGNMCGKMARQESDIQTAMLTGLMPHMTQNIPPLSQSPMECLCTQVRTSIVQLHTIACNSESRGMHALSPNSQRCRCMLCKHGRHPAVLGTNPLDTVRTEKEERGKWNFMHLVPTTQCRYRHTTLYRLVCPSVMVARREGLLLLFVL